MYKKVSLNRAEQTSVSVNRNNFARVVWACLEAKPISAYPSGGYYAGCPGMKPKTRLAVSLEFTRMCVERNVDYVVNILYWTCVSGRMDGRTEFGSLSPNVGWLVVGWSGEGHKN